MNNLYAITFGQRRSNPFIAADYLLIKLDGDPGRSQRELADQFVQRRTFSHFPTFTIESNQQSRVSRGLRMISQAG
jgi:hypothetical protein